jgi:ubiquinone/menaquinone biosynthesis C-methylase UbiE
MVLHIKTYAFNDSIKSPVKGEESFIMQSIQHGLTQDKKNEIETNLYQLQVEGDGYHGSWWPEEKWRRILSFFEQFHNSSTRYKVLDLGCGGMTLTQALMRYPNFEVVGIDLVFEILRRIAKARAPHVSLITGDAEFLPFKSGRFDIVIHSQVLHHFLKREAILNEIKRVLRSGGLLEGIETNGWNPYVIYEHYSNWSKIKPFISKNENPFSWPRYRSELEKSGFKILGWRMVNFDFIKMLSPLDGFFGKIPLFNLLFGGSMLVSSQKVN